MKKSTASEMVNVKELREQLPKYIEAVAKGRSFTVIKRSKPVFRITPVNVDDDDEGLWETVVDFTKIQKGGVDARTILEHIQAMK